MAGQVLEGELDLPGALLRKPGLRQERGLRRRDGRGPRRGERRGDVEAAPARQRPLLRVGYGGDHGAEQDGVHDDGRDGHADPREVSLEGPGQLVQHVRGHAGAEAQVGHRGEGREEQEGKAPACGQAARKARRGPALQRLVHRQHAGLHRGGLHQHAQQGDAPGPQVEEAAARRRSTPALREEAEDEAEGVQVRYDAQC
mmetsp:Transcript_102354/g.285178  ORF Transcript_102354/g.285178 Transcript_102354/m.285178 type:complete len:200 (-) Transcript_102354:490-1089(-)